MKEIGIKIKVIPVMWTELSKEIEKANTMMFLISWSADQPDAEDFLQLLYGPFAGYAINGTLFNNAEYNKLYTKATTTIMDDATKERVYKQMKEMADEEVPMIFLPLPSHKNIYHSWVKNYIWSNFNYAPEKYMDVDMSKKNAYK